MTNAIVMLVAVIHYTLDYPLGFWVLFASFLLVFSPIIVYPLRYEKIMLKRNIADLDLKVIDTARRYGGVLTKSVAVYEWETTLEEVSESLDRFCEHGEASKKKIGPLVIYDFPSARIHLGRFDIRIVEILRDNYSGLSRVSLLQASNLSIEGLEESLKRLESSGVVYYDELNDEYRLRGTSST